LESSKYCPENITSFDIEGTFFFQLRTDTGILMNFYRKPVEERLRERLMNVFPSYFDRTGRFRRRSGCRRIFLGLG